MLIFWLSNRLFKQLPVLTRPTWRLLHPPALSSQSNSFPMGHVEGCFDLRTPLEGYFSSRQVVTW